MKSIVIKFSLIAMVFFTLGSKICSAQQQHFIYIQSENRQPFYVKLDSKLISSTSSGYAIISKISKSDVDIQIGFPKNEFPTQKLYLNVNGDAGYNLKNFGDGKWGLFNLQTMQIVYAGDKKEENVIVANSSSLNTDIKKENPAEVFEETKETSIAATNVFTKDSKPSNTKELISKTKEDDGERMYTAVYKVEGVNSAEYIDVSIAKTITAQIEQTNSQTKKLEIKEADAVKEAKAIKEDERKFLEIELQNPNTKPDSQMVVNSKQDASSQTIDNKSPKTLSFNSDCTAQATEEDFFGLRKSMAAKRTDEEMRAVAIKFFKKKCFTTQQIKGLANILLVEESRLSFYSSAYAFTSDPQNYGRLKAELSTNDLKERFDNIIK